jgi:hypothetical protein
MRALAVFLGLLVLGLAGLGLTTLVLLWLAVFVELSRGHTQERVPPSGGQMRKAAQPHWL